MPSRLDDHAWELRTYEPEPWHPLYYPGSDVGDQRHARGSSRLLCEDEREPKRRAALALGTWRRKLPQLELALTGPLTEHHGRLMQGKLELMEWLERQVAELDEQLRDATESFAPQLDLLQACRESKRLRPATSWPRWAPT